MNRQNDTKTLVYVFLCMSPVVVWLALLFASCYEEDIKLFLLLERITLALNTPFKLSFNEYSY